jgi:hypothetical protein
MATWATATDLQNYNPAMFASMSDDVLETLIRNCEKDVDRLLPRGSDSLTDMLVGITLDPTVDSGAFEVQMVWRGSTFTTPAINWDDDGNTVLNDFLAMTDVYGNMLPSTWPAGATSYDWEQPLQREDLQNWAFGPFPGVPVVLEAINQLGRQPIADLTIVNNTLTTPDDDGNPSVTVLTVQEGGLRASPYLIPTEYADALRDATCAQCEYRNTMGEDFFIRAQFSSTSGPEFKTTGKLPTLGPKVMRELQGTDLVQRGARARPGTSTSRQVVYAPVGSTPIPDDWRSI